MANTRAFNCKKFLQQISCAEAKNAVRMQFCGNYYQEWRKWVVFVAVVKF